MRKRGPSYKKGDASDRCHLVGCDGRRAGHRRPHRHHACTKEAAVKLSHSSRDEGRRTVLANISQRRLPEYSRCARRADCRLPGDAYRCLQATLHEMEHTPRPRSRSPGIRKRILRSGPPNTRRSSICRCNTRPAGVGRCGRFFQDPLRRSSLDFDGGRSSRAW